MKVINKNILFIMLAFSVVVSCDTAGGIDDETFASAGNAPLASWVVNAEGSDDLILSDLSSAVDYEIEFIDESDGSSVEGFTMTVSDGDNIAVLINQTSFTSNGDGIQGFSGSFSLSDIFSALGTNSSDYAEEDEFNFVSTVISGGIEYPSGNSATFSNSVRDFELSIPIETVELTAFSVDSVYLNANSVETISMAFANDFTIGLESLPTITRISAKDQVDDVVGEVLAVKDVDGVDSVYSFTYTPGSAAVDTISFIVSGASAVTTEGFTMAEETFNTVFIIDNINPIEVADVSSLQTGASSDTLGYRVNILFSEDVGNISMASNYIGVDDDEDGEIDEEDEFNKLDATFSANVLDYTFPWTGSVEGEVELTLEVRDKAGNILNYGTYITLTPTP